MTLFKSEGWWIVFCNSRVKLADTMVIFLPLDLSGHDHKVLKDVDFIGTKRAGNIVFTI